MKVKTIVHGNPGEFDNQVNTMLERGYLLEHRGLIGPTGRGEIKHYAQMTLPDPAPESQPVEIDPWGALLQVQAFCQSVDQNDCGTDRCPLNGWCQRLRDCADPTDWDLQEV